MKQNILLALLVLCSFSCVKETDVKAVNELAQAKKDSIDAVLSIGSDSTINSQSGQTRGPTDWRDPFIGKYEGPGQYTNYQTYVPQGSIWKCLNKFEILKDAGSTDGLIIRREKMASFKPESWVQDYFVVSLEYVAKLDENGLLTIPKQELKTLPLGAATRQYVIYDRSTDPKGDIGSYGQFNKDTLTLRLTFSNVSIIDSTVLVKR